MASNHEKITQFGNVSNVNGDVYQAESITFNNDTELSKIVELLEKELSFKNEQLQAKDNQIAFLQNLYTQKPEISEKAKELAKQIPDNADDYALALKAIAEGQFDKATQLLDKLIAEEENKLQESKNNLVKYYQSRGEVEYYQGLYSQAADWYQKALALKPEDAALLNNTGLMLYHAGKYAEAEPLLQRSLAILEKVLGKEHPNVATSLNNLALLYKTQGQYAEAEPLYQRSLAIWEKVLGKEHPNTKTVRKNYEALLAEMKPSLFSKIKAYFSSIV